MQMGICQCCHDRLLLALLYSRSAVFALAPPPSGDEPFLLPLVAALFDARNAQIRRCQARHAQFVRLPGAGSLQ